MRMAVLPAAAGQRLTGWGRATASWAEVTGPMKIEQVRELVLRQPQGGVLARGAGLSYGDAAQNEGGYVLSPVTRPRIELSPDGVTVRASASVTFAEVLARIVPHGRILPVLPGTRALTVGGAIAADVHGKNQRADGTIGSWVEEVELLDGSGELRSLTPAADPEGFRAIVGGMGLTGIVLAATIRLLPVRSALLRVTSRRLPGLDALLAALDSSRSRYSVAWVDTTASGGPLGRGVLDEGDHLDEPDPRLEACGLAYRPARARRAPALPFCPVTPWSARGFNSLWYRKAPAHHTGVASLSSYFHRLDALAGWNLVLGPRGFVQYQFVVPDGAEAILAEVLEAVRRERCAPFLGTLKRFRPARPTCHSRCLAGHWRWTYRRATRGSPPCCTGWTRGSPRRVGGSTWPRTPAAAATFSPRCTGGCQNGERYGRSSTRPECSGPTSAGVSACADQEGPAARRRQRDRPGNRFRASAPAGC